MVLKLYNTLTRKKEVFKPIKKGEVGIYSCGPTVYNYAHIGNLRTFISGDILKRTFLFNGYKIKHVMNITDIDDKTIKGSKKEGLKLKDFTEKYEKIFLEDLRELNIIKPEIMPKATQHIKEMVSIIKKLLEKGYAYKAEDGIYFSVSKFKNYGKLANLNNLKTKKSRIKNDEYDKDSIQDFALWKFWTEDDGDIFWETEIGKGRPGWHIECSAMSSKYLGQPFDIHTGAIDLIFPHHTNEIAQSEAAFNKKFVNYWIHFGFLNMKEGKMSKSLGNILTLKDLKEKGYSGLIYRYLTLTTHCRSPLLFSMDILENAKNSYTRLKNIILEIKDDKKTNEKYLKEFEKAMDDDLNTPEALQVLWRLARDEKAEGKYQTIAKIDEVFGLKLLEKEKTFTIKITDKLKISDKINIKSDSKLPKEISELIIEREGARKNKDWKKADEIRDKINKEGYNISDTNEGPKITKI